MSLSTTLNTNEVKDRAGTEVEFSLISRSGRENVWGKVGELPSYPHRLRLAHEEIGSGKTARRRSVLRVEKSNAGADALGAVIKTSAQLVLDIPVGNSASMDDAKDVLAELTSLVATLATNTFLYDGTGNGAAALIGGSVV
jgi:hypothetical protein